MQGPFSAAHPERDEAKGLTYNYAMNFGGKGQGIYTLFCIPDKESEPPYTLARLQHDPCYAHRSAIIIIIIIVQVSSWDCVASYSRIVFKIHKPVQRTAAACKPAFCGRCCTHADSGYINAHLLLRVLSC